MLNRLSFRNSIFRLVRCCGDHLVFSAVTKAAVAIATRFSMATSHLAQGPAGYMGPVNSFAKNCWSWLAAFSLGGALLSALLKLLFWTTAV